MHTSVREVLDLFEACARCGYPAHAWAIERHLVGGQLETEIVVGCGLPCGWEGRSRFYLAELHI